jgi:hypothetical protein
MRRAPSSGRLKTALASGGTYCTPRFKRRNTTLRAAFGKLGSIDPGASISPSSMTPIGSKPLSRTPNKSSRNPPLLAGMNPRVQRHLKPLRPPQVPIRFRLRSSLNRRTPPVSKGADPATALQVIRCHDPNAAGFDSRDLPHFVSRSRPESATPASWARLCPTATRQPHPSLLRPGACGSGVLRLLARSR